MMKAFYKAKLIHKLFFGYILLIGLTIAIGSVGLLVMRTVERDFFIATTQSIPGINLLRDLNNASLRLVSVTSESPLLLNNIKRAGLSRAQETVQIKYIKEKVIKAQDVYLLALKHYKTFAEQDSHLSQQAQSIEKISTELINENQKLFDLFSKPDVSADAILGGKEKIDSIENTLLDKLNANVKLAISNLNTQTDVVSKSITSAEQHIITLTLLSILFGLLLSWVIGHAITDQETIKENMQKEYQKKLALSERQAGMADLATDIVHNIGNVLNSVNVSAALLKQKAQQSEVLKFYQNINRLLHEHENDLGEFISNDSRGKLFPQYLKVLAESLNAENTVLLEEICRLDKNVAHIIGIVSTQQSLTSSNGVSQSTDIAELIEDSLKIFIQTKRCSNVEIIRQFNTIKPVVIDRIKLLQIITNLIKNALDALTMSDREKKQLTLSIKEKDDHHFTIRIMDNGVGIPSENITKIFTHGFTTKKNGHGFGLHTSANYASEMGGSLKAESDGDGKGSLFTLVLPYLATGCIGQSAALQNETK